MSNIDDWLESAYEDRTHYDEWMRGDLDGPDEEWEVDDDD